MTIGTNQEIIAEDILNVVTSLLTNKSGSTRAAGDVVVFDTANDSAYKTTTYQQDVRVMGVVRTSTTNNNAGPVYTLAGTKCTVNCDTAAVAKGQFLITSVTAGKATAGSYFREPGVFAIALTAKSAGSNGTVQAMLVDNFRQALIGTAGWTMGGYPGAASTVTQKFTMANETWSTIASAALPAVRYSGAGISGGTSWAYAINGNNGSANQTSRYKVNYATEQSSTLTVSSSSRDNLSSGVNFSTKGYVSGGNNGGGLTTNLRTTHSTDAEASVSSISSGRLNQVGVSDGTYVYIGGNTAVTTDRMDNATETLAVHAAAALATAAIYCSVSFPATAGYRAYNNGSGTVYSRKLTFSSGTDANNASSPSGDISAGVYVTDGIAFGYMVKTSACQKLASSTGQYSSLTAYSNYQQAACASYAAL